MGKTVMAPSTPEGCKGSLVMGSVSFLQAIRELKKQLLTLGGGRGANQPPSIQEIFLVNYFRLLFPPANVEPVKIVSILEYHKWLSREALKISILIIIK